MSGARIAGFVLRCLDVARTAAFYEAAFGAVLEEGCVRLGGERVWLAQASGGLRLGPVNATSFQHFAIVVRDMAAAYAHLRGVAGWRAISRGGPVRLPESSGGVCAFKFRDVDGHPLELLEFPAGGVPAVWRGQDLFLGIDHTAITVAETERAVRFYGGLGFSRSGGSLNAGVEQGALDGVDDPVVEVTPLRLGEETPHLELLCYRRPAVVADARGAGDVLGTEVLVEGVGGDGKIVDGDGHNIDFM